MLVVNLIVQFVLVTQVVFPSCLGLHLSVEFFSDESLAFLFSEDGLLLLFVVQESVEFLDSVPLVVFVNLRVDRFVLRCSGNGSTEGTSLGNASPALDRGCCSRDVVAVTVTIV